ncbi:hypothetical protein N752_00045 [Desulforamulus aquiferis]|nr:hypothetical protein N752_00045 [Desulforamulus aquiferis]
MSAKAPPAQGGIIFIYSRHVETCLPFDQENQGLRAIKISILPDLPTICQRNFHLVGKLL